MADPTSCFPACEPNIATDIPGAILEIVPTCPDCPPPTNTVSGVDCDGVVVSVTGAGVVQTVPNPNTVQLVKICAPDAEYDHVWLCDPTTGDRINVVTTYSLTGIPSSVAYTVTGGTWSGSIASLVVCPDSDVESDFVLMCDGGTTFLRWVIKKDGVPTGVVFDTDLSSAPYTVVSAPTVGECALSKLRIYLERNVGVVSISDIVAATGSDKILSVTVKQIAATGSVTADSGSGVPLSVGETWSWSAVSNGNTDTFYGSVLTMDSGGGEQRITATYI